MAEEVSRKTVVGDAEEDVITAFHNFRRLTVIREQCQKIFKFAQDDRLSSWLLHEDKLEDAVGLTASVMRDRFGDEVMTDASELKRIVPPHSRFRHVSQTKIQSLFEQWTVQQDQKEATRRIVDLILVSVLLDAGAGPNWSYTNSTGKTFTRSEGLAEAAFEMFESGLFSSDPENPHQVDSLALKELEAQAIERGFQVGEDNQMIGLAGRTNLLRRLGKAMDDQPQYFGDTTSDFRFARPGNLVDFLLSNEGFDESTKTISVHILWDALMQGLQMIWPRVQGDIWTHPLLEENEFVPFHKLSQWLCYSLIEAFGFYGIRFADVADMTGLAEYRNGGLFLDCGVIVPRDESILNERHTVDSPVIVEFRALTIVLLDALARRLRQMVGLDENDCEGLPLAVVLEGGTWAAGRRIAFERRGGASPIKIHSDGNVF